MGCTSSEIQQSWVMFESPISRPRRNKSPEHWKRIFDILSWRIYGADLVLSLQSIKQASQPIKFCCTIKCRLFNFYLSNFYSGRHREPALQPAPERVLSALPIKHIYFPGGNIDIAL